MVVDGDMDDLPAGCGSVSALIALLSPVTGDAVADPIEFAQLFDVDMDHLAGAFAFIPANGGRRYTGFHRYCHLPLN